MTAHPADAHLDRILSDARGDGKDNLLEAICILATRLRATESELRKMSPRTGEWREIRGMGGHNLEDEIRAINDSRAANAICILRDEVLGRNPRGAVLAKIMAMQEADWCCRCGWWNGAKLTRCRHCHDVRVISPPPCESGPDAQAYNASIAEQKRYLQWSEAGGPNECTHGIAAGIACKRCDSAPTLDPATTRTAEAPARCPCRNLDRNLRETPCELEAGHRWNHRAGNLQWTGSYGKPDAPPAPDAMPSDLQLMSLRKAAEDMMRPHTAVEIGPFNRAWHPRQCLALLDLAESAEARDAGITAANTRLHGELAHHAARILELTRERDEARGSEASMRTQAVTAKTELKRAQDEQRHALNECDRLTESLKHAERERDDARRAGPHDDPSYDCGVVECCRSKANVDTLIAERDEWLSRNLSALKERDEVQAKADYLTTKLDAANKLAEKWKQEFMTASTRRDEARDERDATIAERNATVRIARGERDVALDAARAAKLELEHALASVEELKSEGDWLRTRLCECQKLLDTLQTPK